MILDAVRNLIEITEHFTVCFSWSAIHSAFESEILPTWAYSSKRGINQVSHIKVCQCAKLDYRANQS